MRSSRSKMCVEGSGNGGQIKRVRIDDLFVLLDLIIRIVLLNICFWNKITEIVVFAFLIEKCVRETIEQKVDGV
jgi:hypothetical protein